MKKVLFFLLIVAFHFETFAQLDFDDQKLISQVSEAWNLADVFSADLDGDNDLDLLVASYDQVYWYENEDGAGSFGEKKIIDNDLSTMRQVHAADLDNDDDMDVISISRTELFWYENLDGLGNYSEKNLIHTGLGDSRKIVSGDLDGNGYIDFVIPDEDLDALFWYKNLDGAGDFSIQNIGDNSIDAATAAQLVDLDGDGDLDVLATWGSLTSNQRVAWFRNTDGMGSFSNAIVIATDISRPHAVAAADIDNDNDLDILAGVAGSNNAPNFAVRWYENLDGNGDFGNGNHIGYTNAACFVLHLADMDSDGDTDAIAGGYYRENQNISWFRNEDGQGTFGERIQFDTAKNPLAVLPVDINGDSHLDIVAGTANDDQIAWYENLNSSGAFSAPNVITISDLKGPVIVHPIDFDEDGDLDLLSSSGSDWKTGWYENEDSVGGFGDFQLLDEDYFGAGVIRPVDLDADGDIDYTLIRDGGVQWKENLGGATNFSAPQWIGEADTYQIVDFDGDNDLDIVIGLNDILDGVAWAEHLDGQGNFANKVYLFYSSDNELQYIFAGDADNDSDVDILYVDEDDDLIWRKQEAAGEVGTRLFITFQIDEVIDILDIDGDNYLDIFFKKNNEIKRWEYNPVNDAFEEIASISSSLNNVQFEDIDNDGDLDMIDFTSSFPFSIVIENVKWHINEDGLGTFGPEQISSGTIEKPDGGFATDIDLDGDIDLVGNFITRSKIVWYENTNPLPLSIINTSLTAIDCNASIIQIEPFGGIEPYSYSLDGVNFQDENNFEVIVGDTITVYLQDSTGTLDSLEVPVISTYDLAVDYLIDENNISLTGIGGTPEYVFSLDGVNFQSSNQFTDLPPGDYTAYIKDALDCISTIDFTIVSGSLTIDQITITTLNCHTALIQIQPSAGSPPYSYSLDSVQFQSMNSFEVPAGDTIEVFVKDNDEFVVSTGEIAIPNPDTPTLSIEILSNNIILSAMGGMPPYTYSLDGINFQLSNEFFDLDSGEYTAMVKDSLGCTASVNFMIMTTSADQIVNHGFDFSIIPNPNKGYFQLFFENAGSNTIQMKIYNAQGKILFEEKIMLSSIVVAYPINLSQLGSGVFFVQIQSEDDILTRRLLITD